MMAFLITGVIALTLLVSGTLVGQVYRALGIYAKCKYSTPYIHKLFAGLEKECSMSGFAWPPQMDPTRCAEPHCPSCS